MKSLLILFLALVAVTAHAEGPKITGTFESDRLDILMGIPDSVTAKHKDSLEKSKQTIIITEKDITLKSGFGGGINMTYTTQGDFLLGKAVIGQAEMFYPVTSKMPILFSLPPKSSFAKRTKRSNPTSPNLQKGVQVMCKQILLAWEGSWPLRGRGVSHHTFSNGRFARMVGPRQAGRYPGTTAAPVALL